MKLFRTTVHLLVAIPDEKAVENAPGWLADSVSGVLTDMGTYVDATQPGGPLGIVDWGYATYPTYYPPKGDLEEFGWEYVDPEGVVDADGFVMEGAFLGMKEPA